MLGLDLQWISNHPQTPQFPNLIPDPPTVPDSQHCFQAGMRSVIERVVKIGERKSPTRTGTAFLFQPEPAPNLGEDRWESRTRIISGRVPRKWRSVQLNKQENTIEKGRLAPVPLWKHYRLYHNQPIRPVPHWPTSQSVVPPTTQIPNPKPLSSSIARLTLTFKPSVQIPTPNIPDTVFNGEEECTDVFYPTIWNI